MIHEQNCTYEVAKLAKEKGFPLQKVIKQDGRAFFYELPQSHPDWANCDAWYLPTQSLLQRWLREEKGVTICVDIFYDGWFFDISTFYKQDTGVYEVDIPYKSSNVTPVYPTYELALEDALKYALENLV